jgi:hypothetical protein
VTVLIQQLIYNLEQLNSDEDINEPNHNKYSKVNPEQHEYSKVKADSVEIITGFQKLELKLTLEKGNPNKCKKLSVHF